MIERLISTSLLLLLITAVASAQDSGPLRCVATVYRLNGERWKLIKSVEFVPKLAEEELSSEIVKLPGSRLNLFASVFPTDESLGSARGADSLKIGLATSRHSRGSAFDFPNNAVAEVTLSGLDTVRVERTPSINGRPMLTRLECWDAELEKKIGRDER